MTEGVGDILISNLTLSHTRTHSITCRHSSLAEIVIMLIKLFTHAEGAEDAFVYLYNTDLMKNNPSVSCADSSLYTREPWFAINRKLKRHTVKEHQFDNVFRVK